ncbi:hypothetical protein [Myxosarcina sp. GI1]|uniref:hypothetical protein n=1 Tax=Myxosarcina sp. GI1 TaxID=1541065 RepID=UPI000A400E3E|nr:hypothetical protein [Myxosarcina sp. GI1]
MVRTPAKEITKTHATLDGNEAVARVVYPLNTGSTGYGFNPHYSTMMLLMVFQPRDLQRH